MDGTMTLRVDDEQLATLKFGVGQPVLRNEDPALVQGRGVYTDDFKRSAVQLVTEQKYSIAAAARALGI